MRGFEIDLGIRDRVRAGIERVFAVIVDQEYPEDSNAA